TSSLSDSLGTISNIRSQVQLVAGLGTDRLNVDAAGDTASRSGTLGSALVAGFGMTGSGVVYTAFEDLSITLGSGSDGIYIDETHAGTTTIDSRAGDDRFIVHATSGVVTLLGGAGNDDFKVNFNSNATQTDQSLVRAALNLRGQAGSDTYNIGLAGQAQARISVRDDAPTGDLGVNSLVVFGTDNKDTLFFRPHAILALSSTGVVGERIDYSSDLNGGLTVFGRAGDDTFVFDDNSMVMTVFGDAGDDTFQVGQMFQSQRDAYAGLAVEDQFETTLTTQGYLSNGVSY